MWHCSEDFAVRAPAVIPGLAAMTTVLLVNALCVGVLAESSGSLIF